jgi:hypothetical protein
VRDLQQCCTGVLYWVWYRGVACECAALTGLVRMDGLGTCPEGAAQHECSAPTPCTAAIDASIHILHDFPGNATPSLQPQSTGRGQICRPVTEVQRGTCVGREVWTSLPLGSTVGHWSGIAAADRRSVATGSGRFDSGLIPLTAAAVRCTIALGSTIGH